MLVLVTGATGFIWLHAVALLHVIGHDVRIWSEIPTASRLRSDRTG